MEYPKANNIVVIGSFFFLSILKYKISLGSNSKSSQEPLPGIILQLNNNLPLLCVLPLSWSKKTPGLLCIWFTTTLSTPLTTNVPLEVIKGSSPMKTSCSFADKICLVFVSGSIS